jgi:pyruvate formate lyase activating enzyme
MELKRQGIHTELTDLIIPQVGENLEEAGKLCRWLYDNLGADTPIQFTRFHPDYKMLDLPDTPYEVLEKHYKVGKDAGLNYVYIGNVPGNPY